MRREKEIGKRNAKYSRQEWRKTNAKQRGIKELRQTQRVLGLMIEDEQK